MGLEVQVLSRAQMEKPEFLYHGSVVADLKILEPRKRFTPSEDFREAVIYATPVVAYAAAHAFPWSSDEGFDLKTDDIIELIVPTSQKERLHTPISVYKVPADSFEHLLEEETGLTWHSSITVPVLEEKKFSSVVQALESLGGVVRYS